MSNRMKVSQLSQHPSCPAPTRPDLSSECERFKRTAPSCTSSSFSIDITVDSRNSSTYGNCLRLDSSSGHQKQPQSQSNQAQPHRTPSQRPPETQTTKPPKRPQESSLGSPIELASNVTCSATAMSDSHVQQGKSTPTSHNCLSSDIAVCRILDASPPRQHLLYILPNPNWIWICSRPSSFNEPRPLTPQQNKNTLVLSSSASSLGCCTSKSGSTPVWHSRARRTDVEPCMRPPQPVKAHSRGGSGL